jgi:hypothetical protein
LDRNGRARGQEHRQQCAEYFQSFHRFILIVPDTSSHGGLCGDLCLPESRSSPAGAGPLNPRRQAAGTPLLL